MAAKMQLIQLNVDNFTTVYISTVVQYCHVDLHGDNLAESCQIVTEKFSQLEYSQLYLERNVGIVQARSLYQEMNKKDKAIELKMRE